MGTGDALKGLLSGFDWSQSVADGAGPSVGVQQQYWGPVTQ